VLTREPDFWQATYASAPPYSGCFRLVKVVPGPDRVLTAVLLVTWPGYEQRGSVVLNPVVDGVETYWSLTKPPLLIRSQTDVDPIV
jgi:hypothetical protein